MLLKEYPNKFALSVSYTTRAPRPGESHGVHYYFVSDAEFEQMATGGQFVEHCLVHGKRYGTAASELKRIVDAGKVCIVEIDVQGAQKVAKSQCEAHFVFIYPPSPAELRARLTLRGTETPAQLESRLATSAKEIEFAEESGIFQHSMVNINYSYAEFKQLLASLYGTAILQPAP